MHPEQFPPELSDDDRFAFKWHETNVGGFSRDSGLMPMLIESLNLDEASRELFILKQNMIYQFKMKREMEKERKQLDKAG